MTREEAIEKFRHMWKKMGELKIDKSEYSKSFPEEDLSGVYARCYLCQYIEEDPSRECCPIDWKITDHCNTTDPTMSLFRQWEEACRYSNRDEMGRLALLISKLPEAKED